MHWLLDSALGGNWRHSNELVIKLPRREAKKNLRLPAKIIHEPVDEVKEFPNLGLEDLQDKE